jgi:hypothetical protein
VSRSGSLLRGVEGPVGKFAISRAGWAAPKPVAGSHSVAGFARSKAGGCSNRVPLPRSGLNVDAPSELR